MLSKNKTNFIEKIFFCIVIFILFPPVLGCNSKPAESVKSVEQPKSVEQAKKAEPSELEGWDKSKWGMTEDEILEAFKGEVKKLPKPEDFKFAYANLWIPKFKIDSQEFNVYFQMGKETKKLEQVRIEAKGTYLVGVFGHLEQLLTQKYGPPVYKDTEKTPMLRMVTTKRQWNLPKTVIRLYHDHIGNEEFISLMYRPNKVDKRI
jgi:hypothetical protein